MKEEKNRPTVSAFVTGRLAEKQGAQTTNQLSTEELQKYASKKPLFRPPPRKKEST